MLDLGWSEMAVIALVALIVLGPKELPVALRTVGQWVRKARRLAHEFQSGIDEMMREAELDEARKHIEATKHFNIDHAVEKAIDPTGSVKEEARSLEAAARDDGSERSSVTRTDKAKPDRVGEEEEAVPDSDAAARDREPEGAQVIKHPLQIAPAHSVKPPREPADAENELAQPGANIDDSTQKRA